MYAAYVTTLKEIRDHTNADRLKVATVFGNDVIVDTNYFIGQKVIYFPTDGQLSEEYANDCNLVRKKDENGNNIGGYLDPNKRNITAIKLRGEKSDGLVMPIESLERYGDISRLKDGDQITVFNGHEICCKYIPKTNRRRRLETNKHINNKEMKETISYPIFIEHSDTAQLAYNQGAFKPGDICTISLKMHGTSARTSNTLEVTKKKRPDWVKKLFNIEDKVTKAWKYVTGTRRTTLRNYDGGYYGSNEFRMKWHEFFEGKLPKGMEIYYEIVGWTHGDQTIMGRCQNKLIKDKEFTKQYGKETVFSYGCEPGENDIYVYRMTMMNEDGYMVELPWNQVQIECEKMGVKCVPTFETFIFTTWEDLMERVEKYYDGPDPVGKTHIREGVVVRIENREKFTAYKHKNFSFKCVSGIIVDNTDITNSVDEEILEEM